MKMSEHSFNGYPKIPEEIAGRAIEDRLSSSALLKEFLIALLKSIDSPLFPPCHLGPTAWMMYLQGRFPGPVTVASPVSRSPCFSIYSFDSFWISGPPTFES